MPLWLWVFTAVTLIFWRVNNSEMSRSTPWNFRRIAVRLPTPSVSRWPIFVRVGRHCFQWQAIQSRGRAAMGVSVVETQLGYLQLVAFNPIHHAVLIRESA